MTPLPGTLGVSTDGQWTLHRRRERERERERETDTERERDRQTERERIGRGRLQQSMPAVRPLPFSGDQLRSSDLTTEYQR